MTRLSIYVKATIPALVILGFFVWFANWIPQTQWTPPERHAVNAGMTPLELAKIGKSIVRQRGCLACHTLEPGAGVNGQGRGPNLAQVAPRRALGVPGGPDNLVDYLVQALYEPGAYLVEGYADIMPASWGAPAKLRYEEAVAVIDYLQSLGGAPSIRVGDIPEPPSGRAVTVASATGTSETRPTDPVAMLETFECLSCHSLEPGEVLVGPPFDAGALKRTATERGASPEAYLIESIVAPRAIERDDFPKEVMPDDYGDRLTAAQLQAMISYLLAERGTE